MYVEGLVLAGGASRRMGKDKLALPVSRGASASILQHVMNVVREVAGHVSVLVPPDFDVDRDRDMWLDVLRPAPRSVEVSMVPDLHQFRGPLQAMAAAWPNGSETKLVVVAAGDLPGLSVDVLKACLARFHELEALADTDSTVPDGVLIRRKGIAQPLLGLYQSAAGQRLQELVSGGEQRLMRALQHLQLDLVDSDANGWPDWWTRPVHTPDDYQHWLNDA
ncbi:molybdenum cofactor guanylyltransferase [Alicyclobacillus sp. SO9]|uniref:molybdenum cofactor guanylyltransferase n=1 Tax=Alicyclobacillus sp. SO9 TaxID=2665646 RepID=UPI0018E81482|nr:NTP transferase domain-containing protein [Alicyclobacillus sp. SO9]QQE78598.1 NTP transferase domain-containing protein [Alicyclobacillus sp. SO9]